MGNKFLLSFCLWISPLLLLFTGNSKSCFLGVPQVLPLTPPHFPSPSPLHVSAPQWSASPHSPGERLFYLPFQANSSFLSISFPPASAALCLTNNHHINYHSHYCVFDVYIWQLPPWLEPLRALVWAITIAPSPISLVPLGHFQGPPYKIYVKYWHFSAVHPLVHLSLLREKAKFLTPSYLGPHDLFSSLTTHPTLTPSQPHRLFLKHAPISGPLHFIFPSYRALILQVSHGSHSPFLWDLSLNSKAFSDHSRKNNIPLLLITLSLSISLSFFSWHFLSLNIHLFIYLLLSSPIRMQSPKSEGFLVFVHCCISSNMYGSWHKVGA